MVFNSDRSIAGAICKLWKAAIALCNASRFRFRKNFGGTGFAQMIKTKMATNQINSLFENTAIARFWAAAPGQTHVRSGTNIPDPPHAAK